MSRALRRSLFAAALLATLIVPTPARAGGGWETKTCPGCPADGWLLRVASPDGSRVIAVGERGAAVLSSDAGEEWVRTEIPLQQTVAGVAFGDPAHAWVAGYDGAASSSDGGVTWDGAHPDERGVAGLAAAGAARAWTVGPGAIEATADGGRTWTAFDPGDDVDLRDVDFVDDSHGWAVGTAGPSGDRPVVLATADGGRSWRVEPVPLGDGHQLVSVDFVDTAHGWAVGRSTSGSEGVIVASGDGGATWTEQDCVACAALAAVSFVDAEHGWTVGAGGTIRATSDGGRTWTPQPASTAWGSRGLRDVVALAWDRAVAVGPSPHLLVLSPPTGSVIVEAGGGLLVAGIACGVGGIGAAIALRKGRSFAALVAANKAVAAALVAVTVGGIASGWVLLDRPDCSLAGGAVTATSSPLAGATPDGCTFDARPPAENRAPVARDDEVAAGSGGGPVRVDVLANDRDPEGGDLYVRTGLVNGGEAVVDGADRVVFTPSPGARAGTIRYEITDASGATATATVSLR